jgi:pimeloyl-ACP methyl ester carboxylesterase
MPGYGENGLIEMWDGHFVYLALYVARKGVAMDQTDKAMEIFLSKNDERVINEFLDDELDKWNFEYEKKYIQTESGKTFLLESGHDKPETILFLHGYGLNSASGKMFLSELSSKYHVIVPDIMWQIGRSVPNKTINRKQCQESYNKWILEILNYYKISKVIIMGLSFGSWITMNFLIKNQDKVEKAIVISPAAIFAPLKFKLLWRQIRAGLFTSSKTIRQFVQSSYGKTNQIEEYDFKLTTMVMKHCRKDIPSLVPATVFSDEQLRHIKNPVIFMIGSDEEFMNVTKAIQRARRLVSGIKTLEIQNAAHYLNITHTEILLSSIKNFLQGEQHLTTA